MLPNGKAELPGGFATSTSPEDQLPQLNQLRFQRAIARSAPAGVSPLLFDVKIALPQLVQEESSEGRMVLFRIHTANLGDSPLSKSDSVELVVMNRAIRHDCTAKFRRPKIGT